jgi:DNA-binding NarL/FixJ family response regulator
MFQALHVSHRVCLAPVESERSGSLIQGVSDGVMRESLETSVCLIVDSGSVTRNALRKFFFDHGVMQSFCLTASSLEEARSLMEQFQPKVLVLESDANLGLPELLAKHRDRLSDFKDSIVVVLHSGELSEQTADAARQSVDLFLKKPFSLEKFKYRLSMLLAAKSESSVIPPLVRRGIQQLEEKDEDGALGTFRSILQMYPEFPKAIREVARILLARQQWQEAEHWVWRLREDSLLDPDWIPDVIEMASKINRYDYVEWLADAVREMPKSKVKIITSVAHGMSQLAARLASFSKERTRALDLFRKAISVSKHAPETYAEVIQFMYSAEMLVEADILLSMAPEEVRNSEDTKMLLLEYMDRNRDAPEVINAAYQLYRSGVRKPRVYQILIERSKELGRTRQVIVELIEEAGRIHPDWQDTFNAYL